MRNKLNFPIPGFVGDPEWGNQWYVGNPEGTSVSYTETGNLRLEKTLKHTSHAMLNATSANFKRLREGQGVSIGKHSAFTVQLNANKSPGMKVQLAIHAFDDSGMQVSRTLVENCERALYVPLPGDASLVISMRTAGSGWLTVRGLEFSPTGLAEGERPGLHALDQIPTLSPPVRAEAAHDLATLMPVRQALFTGVPLSVIMTRHEARQVLGSLINNRHMLDAKAIVEQFDLYQQLSVKQLRVLFWHGRKSGYVVHALSCIDEIFKRSHNEKDRFVASKLRAEYDFHRDPWSLLAPIEEASCYDAAGPVVHMVGKAMPEKQTGYTVRTKYTVEALRRGGINSVVAVQVAGNHEDGIPETVERDVDGIPTVLFGGPPAKETLKSTWLQQNSHELLALVRRVRPSVIHAHSDFTNGVLATHVGRATGIPVVYESRGFWEETWISRVSKAQGWRDLEHVVKMYGLPDLYDLRRRSERRVRERANRVVTLAQTMKDFILTESPGGEILPENVHLARNAVDGDDFPMRIEESNLRESLGIPAGDVVVGYISSMVEYEGIETLIDGFKRLRFARQNVHLLLVGDGMHLNTLKRYAENAGIEKVVFAGRIPHEDVIRYYHAIDIFVVPRRKSRVTDLVTPLKPFEAFSTGRPVVVSDVAALEEIAKDSGGAARIFPADDSSALATVLSELVDDPMLRSQMGTHGAEWVRSERSWDSNVPTYRTVYESLAEEYA